MAIKIKRNGSEFECSSVAEAAHLHEVLKPKRVTLESVLENLGDADLKEVAEAMGFDNGEHEEGGLLEYLTHSRRLTLDSLLSQLSKAQLVKVLKGMSFANGERGYELGRRIEEATSLSLAASDNGRSYQVGASPRDMWAPPDVSALLSATTLKGRQLVRAVASHAGAEPLPVKTLADDLGVESQGLGPVIRKVLKDARELRPTLPCPLEVVGRTGAKAILIDPSFRAASAAGTR